MKLNRDTTDLGKEAPVTRIQEGHDRPETEEKDLLDEKLEKCPGFD